MVEQVKMTIICDGATDAVQRAMAEAMYGAAAQVWRAWHHNSKEPDLGLDLMVATDEAGNDLLHPGYKVDQSRLDRTVRRE
ncbi:MAG TPA: hypothetical protein VGG32_10590 [Thermoplasmata archaeon]|jgi:hypothetical protein